MRIFCQKYNSNCLAILCHQSDICTTEKERQVHIMKNEIKFTLEPKQRPKLVQEIGNILGTAPHYERVPSCAYDIAGYRLDKEGVLHIPEGADAETVENLIRQLRECGFQDDAGFTEEVPMQQDKLTIAVPRESFTDTALENLQKIIVNRRTLLQRAFQTDSTEVEITEEKINFLSSCNRKMGKVTVPFIQSGECCDQLLRWRWMMTSL